MNTSDVQMILLDDTDFDQAHGLLIELNRELGGFCKDENIKDVLVKILELNQNGNIFCIGAFIGDKMVGIIAASKEISLWHPEKTKATELFWYVKKKYRGNISKMLLQSLQKELDVDVLHIGVPQIRQVKMLEKMGFKMIRYGLEFERCVVES